MSAPRLSASFTAALEDTPKGTRRPQHVRGGGGRWGGGNTKKKPEKKTGKEGKRQCVDAMRDADPTNTMQTQRQAGTKREATHEGRGEEGLTEGCTAGAGLAHAPARTACFSVGVGLSGDGERELIDALSQQLNVQR
jgi:hypothetical protein